MSTTALVLSVIALTVAVAAVGFLLWISNVLYKPIPRRAPAKPAPDCAPPATPAGAPMPLPPAFPGGTHYGQNVTVAAGTTLTLTQSATIISQGDLTINGTIDIAPTLTGPTSITLVSLDKDVVIGAGARVGNLFSLAPDGANDAGGLLAVAIAGAGENGGSVRILAPRGSIRIDGEVRAQFGGRGGTATSATGGVFVAFFNNDNASAAGGQSGAGGDIVLCALETIAVTSAAKVVAGASWRAGDGDATATSGNAYGIGGPGNDGGDIYFNGYAPTTQVIIQGLVEAGFTLPAGAGSARGGAGVGFWGVGGNAEAVGAPGGRGGTVIFQSCVVTQPGRPLSQYGGDGGLAIAIGGPGRTGALLGGPGGSADARGGDGGKPGAIPQQPLPNGQLAPGALDGSRGQSGTSGTATATGGTGGNGRVRGGSSGSATAQAGTGGLTGTVPAPMTAPSAPPAAGTGGAGPTASSPGVS